METVYVAGVTLIIGIILGMVAGYHRAYASLPFYFKQSDSDRQLAQKLMHDAAEELDKSVVKFHEKRYGTAEIIEYLWNGNACTLAVVCTLGLGRDRSAEKITICEMSFNCTDRAAAITLMKGRTNERFNYADYDLVKAVGFADSVIVNFGPEQ